MKLCRTCQKRVKSNTTSGRRWRSIHARSELALRSLKDESVDAIISDPPYAAGATSLLGRLRSSAAKYRTSSATPLPAIDGDSILPAVWQSMMGLVCDELMRTAKPGADLLFFCDWRSMDGMLEAIGRGGFALRTVLVWDKGRGCRPSRNGFRAQSEFVIHARKAGSLERDTDVYLDGVFRHATMSGGRKQHLTEKPLSLMKDLVEIVPAGGLVLDPFQGSGTTGVAALEAGLHYVGIESTEAYSKLAAKRLKAARRFRVRARPESRHWKQVFTTLVSSLRKRIRNWRPSD